MINYQKTLQIFEREVIKNVNSYCDQQISNVDIPSNLKRRTGVVVEGTADSLVISLGAKGNSDDGDKEGDLEEGKILPVP